MLIRLYNNNSEVNKINKHLTSVGSLSGFMRESSNVIAPTIKIEIENINFNYVYISEFNRYYFLQNATYLVTGIWSIDLIVDPLMSYKESLLNNRIIIEHTEITSADNYLSDNAWVSKVKTMTDIINFPSGFDDDGEYILITAGGLS